MKQLKMSLLVAFFVVSVASPARADDCTTKLKAKFKTNDNAGSCLGITCCMVNPFGPFVGAVAGFASYAGMDWYCNKDLKATYALLCEAEANHGPTFNQFVDALIRNEQSLQPNERILLPLATVKEYREKVAEVLKLANEQELFCQDHEPIQTVPEIFQDYVEGHVHRSLQKEKVRVIDMNV